MYEELMNRPMFQTPQRRQAGGIMAGVAPIRGYADGDLVEDDDSMIESLLAQAEELPEALSNLNMEDAVGYVKENPEILLAAIPGLGLAGGVALRFGPGAARSAISLGRRLLTKKKTPKATEADIMGNVPARKAPKGLSAEQQAEGIMGPPTKAAPPTPPPGVLRRVGSRVGSGAKTLGKVAGVGALGAGAYNYLSDSEATPEIPEEEPQVDQAEQQRGGGSNEVERQPNIFQRISGGLGSLAGGTGLSDDGTTPGISERDLIRAGAGLGEGRSGRRRINPALERFRASNEYDEAQKGTALQQNFEFLEEMFPKRDPSELMQIAAGKDPEQVIALTLFDTIVKDNPGVDKREALSLAMELSRQFMAGEVTGAGATEPSAELD